MSARVAVLAVTSPSGEEGGAERFYQGLRCALSNAGVEAELVPVVSDESSFEAIMASYLKAYDLDLSDYDGVISTKAPSYAIRHHNHVCYLVHTMRVFYDRFDAEFPVPTPELYSQRARIHELDGAALGRHELRWIFAIGHEVRERLRAFNGLDAEVLHLTTTLAGLRAGGYRYLLLPGRLHRWKRVDLVIRAMRHVTAQVDLWIAGAGEDEEQFRELAAGDPRIRFLGRVSDEELAACYAEALAVPFVPIGEDLGLVTLEAFHSRKPVITCRDSGEPARLVQDGQTGYVCEPDEQEIARRIDELARDPARASDMGIAGARSVGHISWHNVAKRLLRALDLEAATNEEPEA